MDGLNPMKLIFSVIAEGVLIVGDGEGASFSSPYDWSNNCIPQDRKALAILFTLIEEEKASVQGLSIYIPHKTVAELSSTDAKCIALPPDLPLRLDIRSDGELSHAEFRFKTRWIAHTGLPLQAPFGRNGSIASVSNRSYRIPDPVFSVLEMIDAFNAQPPTDQDEKLLAWGRIRGLLGDAPGELANDYYLRDTRIFSGQRFTLHLEPNGIGDVSIEPVLVAKSEHVADFALSESGLEEEQPVLPGKYQNVFASRFSTFNQARSAYPLEDGVYAVIDPACRQALEVVRKVVSGRPEERLAFCRNPRAALSAALGEKFSADAIEDLFVETENFSARVKEIGLWQKKILPWVQRTGESWLPPEHLGLMVDNKRLEIDRSQLAALKEQIEKRLQEGGGKVEIGTERVDASTELLMSIEALIHEVTPRTEAKKVDDEGEAEKPSRQVLLIHDNLDGIDYQVSKRIHRSTALDTPALLKTQLKQHQREGLRWLQNHWILGSPGALLADDMGLGKTLLVLAFLAWMKEEMAAGMTQKKPILVVAPVGLLKNWEAEHNLHMIQPGIGEMIPVYGQRLKQLKRSNASELESGQSVLNREQLQQADWVLTSYETLRDYQISFGLIPFSVVVFDEAQKIKTPGTLMTEAAKAVNADFTVTMTGTPVENRLADLWCIVDTAQPGVLGDLKSFSNKYEKDPSEEAVHGLKDKIWHSVGRNERPGLMLRRMKEEALDALPEKHLHPIEREMPPIQAEAYANAVSRAQNDDVVIILETLHHLRSISLHPFITDQSGALSDEQYIESSARLSATIEILDEVKRKDEKALIFLESLDMQGSSELPLILKTRYQMQHLPLVINGSIAAVERQKRVDRFQLYEGFDVMILSPRAGGVGLTLTAANHVIHLSRWWNPAVEDQATDRIYRIGQTRPVHVYYPIAIHPRLAEHSFDLKLHALIERKRQLSRTLLVPPSASHDEISRLFREAISR